MKKIIVCCVLIPVLMFSQELLTVENQSVYLRELQMENSELKQKNNEALAFIVQQEKAIKKLEDELYRYYLRLNDNGTVVKNSNPRQTVFVRDTVYKYIREPAQVQFMRDTVYITQQSKPVVQTKYITEYVRDTVYKYIERPAESNSPSSSAGENAITSLAQLPNYNETLEIIREMRNEAPDVNVQMENGLITAMLPCDILFSPGYDEVSSRGYAMLNALIPSIKKLEAKHQIIIIAHTDDISYQNTTFNSNWQLSAENASTIASIMLMNGVQREHLKAYGRAEHDPLVPNDSALNRRTNRRIEMIFKPDLERIYAVLAGTGQ